MMIYLGIVAGRERWLDLTVSPAHVVDDNGGYLLEAVPHMHAEIIARLAALLEKEEAINVGLLRGTK